MTQTAKRQIIVPAAFQAMYDNYRFAPATRVGDTIWLSGQVGIDAQMQPADGMPAQARLAFEYVKLILAEAGATLADVVELTTFHTTYHRDLEAFMAVKNEFFPDQYPSWTAVAVTDLAIPGLLVEIRVVAVAGSGQA